MICLGQTDSVDGTPIIVVENKLELLDKFREILIGRGCNILCGYNTFKFDSAFQFKRAEKYKFDGFKKLSFIKNIDCDLEVKTLQSAALGTNKLEQMISPGPVEIYLFMVKRRSQKLLSYKLNAVCEKFFGGKKDNFTYKDILEACTSKNPAKLGVMAKYCYQDSDLVLKLLDKIKEVYDATDTAKLCTVPLTYTWYCRKKAADQVHEPHTQSNLWRVCVQLYAGQEEDDSRREASAERGVQGRVRHGRQEGFLRKGSRRHDGFCVSLPEHHAAETAVLQDNHRR